MSGPAVASSSAALSRTERVTACSATSPLMTSPKFGPSGLRPRVGFIPKSPQHDAGMRIEPPPSLPCAIGTMPAATAAAEPPDEPPAVRSVRHGLRVIAVSSSVVAKIPISGIRVVPTTTAPAPRSRRTPSWSASATGSHPATEPSPMVASPLVEGLTNERLSQRLSQVGQQIVDCLDPDRQPDQVGRNLQRRAGRARVRHPPGVLDQRLHAAQRLAEHEQPRAV